MWKTIRNVIIGVLAVFGVLFLVLLFLPDDEEDEDTAQESTVAEAVSDEDEDEDAPAQASSSGKDDENSSGKDDEDSSGKDDRDEDTPSLNTGKDDKEDSGKDEKDDRKDDTPGVSEQTITLGGPTNLDIPESELSKETISFRTVTLENEEMSQDIFSDYDLTIVHVWGTYCSPCIAEMGDYGKLYRDLPDNMNLVGIVCDVYDGIDTNVKDAHKILDNADAEFTNLRVSDSVFDLIDDLRYVPSSFFVDREGHMVGEKLDGANVETTKKKLSEYLK